MSMYDSVMKQMPLEEVEQGKYYCYLDKKPNLKMAYVFFDKESEDLLFEGKMPKTLDNCKVVFKKFEVDFDEILESDIDLNDNLDDNLDELETKLTKASKTILIKNTIH